MDATPLTVPITVNGQLSEAALDALAALLIQLAADDDDETDDT